MHCSRISLTAEALNSHRHSVAEALSMSNTIVYFCSGNRCLARLKPAARSAAGTYSPLVRHPRHGSRALRQVRGSNAEVSTDGLSAATSQWHAFGQGLLQVVLRRCAVLLLRLCQAAAALILLLIAAAQAAAAGVEHDRCGSCVIRCAGLRQEAGGRHLDLRIPAAAACHQTVQLGGQQAGGPQQGRRRAAAAAPAAAEALRQLSL